MYSPSLISASKKNQNPLVNQVLPFNTNRVVGSSTDFDKDAYSHRLGRVTGEAIQELSKRVRRAKGKYSKFSYKDYQQALYDPQLRACIELKKLRSGSVLGQYTHSVPKIQDWVRSVLADLKGTIEDLVARSAISTYYGFFTAEIVFKNRRQGFRNEWVLKEFIYHDAVTTGLAGNKYGVTHVIDKSATPQVWIPVNKCIHVANDLDNSRNPFGNPSAEAAMPYIKAKQALISQWLIAGKNHAMGLLVGKASSQNTVTLLDATGKPIVDKGKQVRVSSVNYLKKQFEELEDKNFIATELENEIHWMPLPVDANFFQLAIQYLDRKIMLTQNIPSLIFEEGSASLGSATPAIQQQIMLDAQIHSAVKAVKDQILEKVIKKMLKYNFNIDPRLGYGDFSTNPSSDPQSASLRTQNLLYAMTSGIINNNDLSAINALRESLDLPPQEEKEYLNELVRSAEIQAEQQKIAMESQQPEQQNVEQQNSAENS